VQRLGGRTVVRNSAELKAQLFALLGTTSSSSSSSSSSSRTGGSAAATRGALGAGRTEQFTVAQQQQQQRAVPVSRFGSSRRLRQEAKLQQLEHEQQQLQQQFAA
jgi:hypothetical protein